MRIIKCNKCSKTRKDSVKEKWASGWIQRGDLSFHEFDLCEKCSSPLVKYFKKYLKIKNKKK